MSGIERRAADAAAPSIVYQISIGTSAVALALPAEMIGQFCVFEAEGAIAYLRFGTSSVDVDPSADSAVDEGVVTADPTTPQIIVPAGGERRRRLRVTWTHVAIAGSTDGKLRFGSAGGGWPDD